MEKCQPFHALELGLLEEEEAAWTVLELVEVTLVGPHCFYVRDRTLCEEVEQQESWVAATMLGLLAEIRKEWLKKDVSIRILQCNPIVALTRRTTLYAERLSRRICDLNIKRYVYKVQN